jgi:hypothetical protein
MPNVPVIYLDTQDFSNFGDVLRGKSDSSTEAIFTKLEALKNSGKAIFPVSMPLLGELLQYDADFRETTIKKAEAVERLCGSWALAFPSRLLGYEIAVQASSRGFLAKLPCSNLLSQDRYWYPNVTDELIGLREKMVAAFDTEVASLNLQSRAQRRLAKKARGFDPVKLARAAAPEMAAKYGLPLEAIIGSFVALLRGSITPEQASRKLFGSVAEPVKFVEVYFEKLDTDQAVLPSLMSQMGSAFEALFVELRDRALPLELDKIGRSQLEKMIVERNKTVGRAILGMVDSECEEFGIDPTLMAKLVGDEDFSNDLPACKLYGGLVEAYALQILGLSGSVAKVERSFAGDMVHALYLSHVDIWRGDRRFSTLLKGVMPHLANRVIPTIKELPVAIDAWWATQSSRIA